MLTPQTLMLTLDAATGLAAHGGGLLITTIITITTGKPGASG